MKPIRYVSYAGQLVFATLCLGPFWHSPYKGIFMLPFALCVMLDRPMKNRILTSRDWLVLGGVSVLLLGLGWMNYAKILPLWFAGENMLRWSTLAFFYFCLAIGFLRERRQLGAEEAPAPTVS